MRDRTILVCLTSVSFPTSSLSLGCQSEESRSAFVSSSLTELVSLISFFFPLSPETPETALKMPSSRSLGDTIGASSSSSATIGLTESAGGCERGLDPLGAEGLLDHSRHSLPPPPFANSADTVRATAMAAATVAEGATPRVMPFAGVRLVEVTVPVLRPASLRTGGLKAGGLSPFRAASAPSPDDGDTAAGIAFDDEDASAPCRNGDWSIGLSKSSSWTASWRRLEVAEPIPDIVRWVPPLIPESLRGIPEPRDSDPAPSPISLPASSTLPTSSCIMNSRSPSIFPISLHVTSTPILSFSSSEMPYSDKQTHSLKGWISPTIISARRQDSLPR
mmetsp:Transcript_35970/g.58027  ORF Transcript_35970/g.58027 Transcript_35970/m.58027 type:complete len:334 (+) Transcript_35970:630-1631(+)